MFYDKTYNKLFGALIGVARSVDWYSPIEEPTAKVLVNVLSTIGSSEQLLDETTIKSLTKELHLEKFRLVPDCFTCMNRCGRTDDYDMELLWNAEEDVLTEKKNLLNQTMSLAMTSSTDEESVRYLVKALISLGEAYDADMLKSIIDEANTL